MAEKLLNPPGPTVDLPSPPQFLAPVHDGSFFDDFYGTDIPQGVLVPRNDLGNPMSPVEESTGVVLPIAASMQGWQNRHHAHFYGRQYREGSLGQRAQRFSRLQRMGSEPHTFFHKMVEGTAFASSEEEEFKVTVLNAAGYFPNYAVRIHEDEIWIDEITEKEQKLLRRPHILTIEDDANHEDEIGRFLMEYSIKQEFPASKQNDVEEFLAITPEEIKADYSKRAHKLKLAGQLTDTAISVALGPVYPTFTEARQAKQLKKTTQPSAWDVVKGLVKGRECDYFDRLEGLLAKQYAQ